MTLASLPKPYTGRLGEDDDSEEEDEERDCSTSDGRGGHGRRSEKARGRIGGLPCSRRKARIPAECPFDREEILQIWSRSVLVFCVSKLCTGRDQWPNVTRAQAGRAAFDVTASCCNTFTSLLEYSNYAIVTILTANKQIRY